jgi:uncharacterized protein
MITQETIQSIVRVVIETYHPDKIILFGSCAHQQQQKHSDVDLLVIADHEKALPRHQRGLQTRLALPQPYVPKDILFYTHEEIEKWKDVRLSFVATVLREGVVVYEHA